MAEYEIRISGVHYAANGDSVAGQKDTEGTQRDRPSVSTGVRYSTSYHNKAICRRILSYMPSLEGIFYFNDHGVGSSDHSGISLTPPCGIFTFSDVSEKFRPHSFSHAGSIVRMAFSTSLWTQRDRLSVFKMFSDFEVKFTQFWANLKMFLRKVWKNLVFSWCYTCISSL